MHINRTLYDGWFKKNYIRVLQKDNHVSISMTEVGTDNLYQLIARTIILHSTTVCRLVCFMEHCSEMLPHSWTTVWLQDFLWMLI